MTSRITGYHASGMDPPGQITEKAVHLLVQIMEGGLCRSGLGTDDQVTAGWEEILLGTGQLTESALHLVSCDGLAYTFGYSQPHATAVLRQVVAFRLIARGKR